MENQTPEMEKKKIEKERANKGYRERGHQERAVKSLFTISVQLKWILDEQSTETPFPKTTGGRTVRNVSSRDRREVSKGL